MEDGGPGRAWSVSSEASAGSACLPAVQAAASGNQWMSYPLPACLPAAFVPCRPCSSVNAHVADRQKRRATLKGFAG